MVCFDDKKRVTEYTDKYFGTMFETVANHYEFMSDHFKSLPSYSTYAFMGEAAAAAGGPDKAYKDYIAGNMIGTPEELVEHHLIRKEMVGDYEILANFSFGGLPYELVYEQMKLFADKVMPQLKDVARDGRQRGLTSNPANRHPADAGRLRHVSSFEDVGDYAMIRNLPAKWDLEADVVAIGSGIGGLSAAITAHEHGASAIVLERSDQVGGVTALSMGEVWVAGNHHAAALGIEDSAESGFRYLKRLVDGLRQRRSRSSTRWSTRARRCSISRTGSASGCR